MTHPIIEDLLWRHSTKKYDASRKVPESELDVVFEAMRLSASSINSQPWRFVVIESRQARERMSNTFDHQYQNNQPHVFDCSHFILFAYNPRYTRVDYAKVVDKMVDDERVKPEGRESAFGVFGFAERNTDENGSTGCWAKAQTYLALGNTLHALARLRIDSTPIEGIDIDLVNKAFEKELEGYQCDVALAIGYQHPHEDYNAKLPKSRLSMDSVLVKL